MNFSRSLAEVLKANQSPKIPFIPRSFSTRPLQPGGAKSPTASAQLRFHLCDLWTHSPGGGHGGVKYGLAAGDDITLDPEGEMG